jgi:hypothetical protein
MLKAKILFLSAFLVIFVGDLSAQKTDSLCVTQRWISIKPIKENSVLFDFKNEEHPELGIFQVIEKLSFQNKIDVVVYERFNRDKNCFGAGIVKYNLPEIKKNSLLKSHEFVEVLERVPTIPLANVYGEDSVSNDTLQFYYPLRDTIQLIISEVSEVRILETLVLNAKTDLLEFRATAICFYVHSVEIGSRELFWVDLNQLFDNLGVKNEYSWFDFLNEKRYTGEIYQILNCQGVFVAY